MEATHGEDDFPFDGPAPGTIIGSKFTLLRLIAAGGAGAVYEAEDQLVGRRVALKILLPRYVPYPEIVRRFRREAQATATIEHPNVVMILEMGHHRDGTPYIAQELLKGDTLRVHLDRHGAISPSDAIAVLAPIMGALDAAHRHGIVHRDLKPENVILSRSSSGDLIPKLVDFGAAKVRPARQALLTQVGLQIGTPGYMSPEQVRGDQLVDGRTDVWAIGVLLLEMVCGAPVFQAASDAETYVNILSRVPDCLAPRLLQVAGPLRDLLARAIEPDHEKRLPTMHEFRELLWDCWQWRSPAGDGAPARPPKPLRATPPARPPTLEIVHLTEDELDDDIDTAVARAQSAPPPRERRASTTNEAGAGRRGRRAEDVLDAREAEQALAENALDRAIELADEVMAAHEDDDALRGRMCAVQAVAHFWLGAYVASWRKAFVAVQNLPRGGVGWHAAKGHLAMAFGHLGKNDELIAVADDLLEVRPSLENGSGHAGGSPEDWDAHAIAVARVTVFLIRAGAIERASQLFDTLHDGERRITAALACAWTDVARAEMARHRGDPMADLAHVEAAVAGFATAGDNRNACLQRANIGNAYALLGAFEVAEAKLRESLAVAEPMRLSFMEPVKANLGFVLARLGRTEEAIAMLKGAILGCIQQKYPRFEAVAHVYLSIVLVVRGDLGEAESEAREALRASETSPHVRAMALATLARVLLLDQGPSTALVAAREAFDIVARLDGVEEGAGLIALTHAETLEAAGHREQAREALREARARLLEHAARIKDDRWRRIFLEQVPEHAQTLALARRWNLDDPPAATPG